MTTKEQERKALAQIRKIVDGLGADSYIAKAFDGCFEIAEENIENDFACSMKQKADSAQETALKSKERVMELKEKLAEASKELGTKDTKIENLEARVAQLDARRDKLLEQVKSVTDANVESWNKFREQEDRAEAAEAEIVKLKAKLYDLLIKE